MNADSKASPLAWPAIRRLNALCPLEDGAVARLRDAVARTRVVQPHHQLIAEGHPLNETLLFLDGWAARVRQLPDGRRALLSFVLPGDLMGLCRHDRPLASSSVVALTRIAVCKAPPRGAYETLDRAYELSRALEEAYLLAQIARLSRFNAHERLADLLLELLERLELAGLAPHGRYDFPITQEVLSDAIGLSTVHVNRTLQLARKAHELVWRSHNMQILDPARLSESIGRVRTRVSSDLPRAGEPD